ncbi:MAG: hypothetical protein QOJ23_4962, partial [Actinomycetota bacterium]|nr:hypothetical protein [Actinomycetota bacterium]
MPLEVVVVLDGAGAVVVDVVAGG